jgi:GNAT superfamily N-acetyltransferase
MDLVSAKPEYYEFIREMRNHPENKSGFLQQEKITKDQQLEYMEKHSKDYFVCLSYGDPVGYIGVIDDDIRVCTHPDTKGQGVGQYMLESIKDIFPKANGRIKKDNIASQKLFDKCKVPYRII